MENNAIFSLFFKKYIMTFKKDMLLKLTCNKCNIDK